MGFRTIGAEWKIIQMLIIRGGGWNNCYERCVENIGAKIGVDGLIFFFP